MSEVPLYPHQVSLRNKVGIGKPAEAGYIISRLVADDARMTKETPEFCSKEISCRRAPNLTPSTPNPSTCLPSITGLPRS